MKLSSPISIVSLSSMLVIGQNLLLLPTATTAQGCCLCDDCKVDGLYGIEVGVDAPAGSGASTTSLITDCGDLAANLLANTVSTDAECARKKFVYGAVCCPAKTSTTAPQDDTKNRDRDRDLQQWTPIVSYNSFGSTTQLRGGGFPAATTPRWSWWSVPAPAPRPTTQWVPVPRPAPVAVPQPPPPTNNWGGAPPTSTAATGGSTSQDWVNAHNSRRNTYHTQNRVSYVAIKWSEDLASSARTYTQRLLSGFTGCNIQHKFQGDSYGGENLAMQITGNAASYSAEAVMRLWYDGEVGLPYPQNGHLTQVVWRGTMYVGCAGLTKNMGNGQICHIQTCRYIAPGNCNGVGNILAASSPCAPQCPKEGCF